VHRHSSNTQHFDFTGRFILTLLFLIIFGFNLQAQKSIEQKKQEFNNRMVQYVTQHIDDKVKQLQSTPDLFEEDNENDIELLKGLATDELKSEYIHKHMKEYLNTFFSSTQSLVTTDTFVCDNGGFEEGFKFYKGYISTYRSGSNDCTPVDGSGNEIVYIPATTLPLNRRFEIVSNGIDPLIGIKKVKFGNKALKINDKYGHEHNCKGDYGVDKIVKRFRVTDENRDFTVWYAVALENPSSHNNRQPFLNIKCDRDTINELCFDADFLKCEKDYSDSLCPNNKKFKNVDVLNWTCHRFKIPKEFVDSIATLEITVGDCGRSGHVGWAYIDGICEECDSSALGLGKLTDIDYLACDDYDPTAKIFGTITLPTISVNCNNNPDPWYVAEIIIPDYNTANIQIYNNKFFSFDFPLSNFGNEECLDVYAEVYFTNGTDTLPPQLSNSIEICKNQYEIIDCNGGFSYDTCDVSIDVSIGPCHSNGTGGDDDDDYTPNMSDDYYYIYVTIFNPSDLEWRIDRHLVNPYPNENNSHTIAEYSGDTINMQLGPFLIQEGDWWFDVNILGCPFSELILAPDYCSGCEEFRDMEISNITCKDSLNQYWWNFTIMVPNDYSPPLNPFKYNLYVNSSYFGPYKYNEYHPIGLFKIEEGCKILSLNKENDTTCVSLFTICPPKPCSGNCNLEMYVEEVECIFDEREQRYTGYNVILDISGIDELEEKACISYSFVNNNTPYQWGSLSNGIWPVGPFNSDIYLTVSICPKNQPCPCINSDCYKTIYVPNPDCDTRGEIEKKGIENRSGNTENSNRKHPEKGKLSVIPNPFNTEEVILHSTLKRTVFEIFDMSGHIIQHGDFKGREYKLKMTAPPGIYFIKYYNKTNKPEIVKIIKL